MIRLRHEQPSLWEGVWAEEVHHLWEPWMRAADRLLEDDELLSKVFEAQGRRWKQSRRRGWLQTPAEVVLRLMLLKHFRNWSYEVVEREVRSQSREKLYRRLVVLGPDGFNRIGHAQITFGDGCRVLIFFDLRPGNRERFYLRLWLCDVLDLRRLR